MNKKTIVDYFRNLTSDRNNDEKFQQEMSTVVAEMMSKHISAKTIIRENPCAEISMPMVKRDKPQFISIDSMTRITSDNPKHVYQKVDEMDSILGKTFTKDIAINYKYSDEHEREMMESFRLKHNNLLAMGAAPSFTSFKGIRGSTSTRTVVDDVDEVYEIPSLDKVRLWALEYGYSLTKIEFESTELTGTNKIKLKEE